MKISITGQFVVIDDESGNDVHFATRQLIDIMKILNISLNEDETFIFDTLEFRV